MSKQAKAESNSRRNFIKGMAVAGGATALVAAGGASASSEAPASESKTPASKGYRHTAHVAEYYRQARF